jgi:hypothetical protein
MHFFIRSKTPTGISLRERSSLLQTFFVERYIIYVAKGAPAIREWRCVLPNKFRQKHFRASTHVKHAVMRVIWHLLHFWYVKYS